MVTELIGSQVDRDDYKLNESASDDRWGPVDSRRLVEICPRDLEGMVQISFTRYEGATNTVSVLRVPARSGGGP